jgi:putative peptide zinc metalloprotease protein
MSALRAARRRFAGRPGRLLALALVLAAPAGAGAGVALADGPNTSAVAVNTKDGSSVFRLAFAVKKVAGSVVDPQNAAVAVASCDACKTVAISIQIVIVTGTPSTFTPTNEAIAINESCDLCDTLAAAYQFVVGAGTEFRLTPQTRRDIESIRRQLQQLRASSLSAIQEDAEVKQLMTQLGDDLSQGIVGTAPPSPGSGQAGAGTSPSSSPETTQGAPPGGQTGSGPTGASGPAGPSGASGPTGATGPTSSSTTPTNSTPAPTTSTGATGSSGPTGPSSGQ